MSVRILYFGSLRDGMGRGEDRFESADGQLTIAALKSQLAVRPNGTALAQCRNLRCAVNHAMASDDSVIGDGDEVAFFPPVTGG